MVNEYLKRYKEITEKIIKEIDEDIVYLMDEREEILKSICSYEDKNVIRESYFELGLDELDRKLKKKIEEEQLEVKEELQELNKRKNASRGYNNISRVNNIFSTKI